MPLMDVGAFDVEVEIFLSMYYVVFMD